MLIHSSAIVQWTSPLNELPPKKLPHLEKGTHLQWFKEELK
jgi:hypothetical protein